MSRRVYSNPELERVLRAGRRRVLAVRVVHLAPIMLCLSAVLTGVLLAADRLVPDDAFPLTWSIWPYIALSVLGLPAAFLIAWVRQPDAFAVARMLDDSTSALDRLASAVEISRDEASLQSHGPMSALLMADAAATAIRIDVRAALPAPVSTRWTTMALLLLGAVPTAWTFVPQADLPAAVRRFAGLEDSEVEADERIEETEQVIRSTLADARARLEQSRQAFEKADGEADDATLIDDAAVQAVETLDRLERQLAAARNRDQSAQGGSRPSGAANAAPAQPSSDEMLTQTAEELGHVAESLDEEAEQLDTTAREVRSRLSRAAQAGSLIDPSSSDADDSSGNVPVAGLEKSLSDGRIEDAARQLGDLADRVSELTPEQRKQLAERLQRMADHLTPPDSPADNRENPSARELLRDLGLDDDKKLDELEKNGWQPEAVAKALEDAGAEPNTARRTADQIEREQKKKQARQQAEAQAERLADRMREAAEAVDPDSTPSPPTEPEPGPLSRDGQPVSRDVPSEQPAKDGSIQSPQSDSQPAGDGPPPQDSPDQTGKQTDQRQSDGTRADEQQQRGGASDQPQGGSGRKPKATDATEQIRDSPPDDQQAQRQADAQQEPVKQQGAGRTEPAPGPSPSGEADGEQQQEGPVIADPPVGQPGSRDVTDPNAEQAQPEGPQQGDGPVVDDPSAGGRTPRTDEPRDPAEELRRLKEEVERIGKLKDAARDRRLISKDMKDRAKELLDRMTPEEREQVERWARELARENGNEETQPTVSGQDPGAGPLPGLGSGDDVAVNSAAQADRDYDIVDIDARPDRNGAQPAQTADRPRDELTLSRWYRNPSDLPADENGRVIRGITDESAGQQQERLKDAADAVERAVNQEAVAPKYRDYLREWAKRLRKHARENAGHSQVDH